MVKKTKSVLFIGPKFFGYEVSITEAIVENGFVVDFFDERPSNKSFMKAVFRLKKSILNTLVDQYYKRITDKIKNKSFDYFLLIKGEVMPESFIINFKKFNPEAKLIYYTYDAISNNNKNSVYILKHFDKCFSFDFNDVIAYPVLKLKHLFYTKEYVEKSKTPEKRQFTISFVGTLHSNRYAMIKALFKNLGNTFVFFYSPAQWFFWFEKIFRPYYRQIQWKDVCFEKLTKQDVAAIFRDSKSVLDVQRFGQTGLTMRTFEVLASGAILVTSNSKIREADFFDPNYIIVIDEIDSDKNINEIIHKTKKLEGGMLLVNPDFEKYMVTNWVKEFFE